MTPPPLQTGLSVEDQRAFEDSLVADVDGSWPSGVVPPSAPAAKDAGPAQPVWMGKKLGHFKLLQLIGQGAMGFVVQALDVDLQRIVALKILRHHVDGLDERQQVEQFLREARGAARIDHPNVVRVYEIAEHAGWWYIAMEMIDGKDLRKVVRTAGPLAPPKACALIADAATALAVAHELGIVHRDVKPSNLLINRAGRCKLTDFGFVRIEDPSEPFDFTDKSVGTPKFMAPEVIRRRPPTPAIDVYSLGATLFYALTGRPPYDARTLRDICQGHLKAPPPDLCESLPDCSGALADLVRRMMAKDPQQRPSATEVATALCPEFIPAGPDDSGVGSASGSTLLLTDRLSREATPSSLLLRPVRTRWAVLLALAAAGVFVAAVVMMLAPLRPSGSKPTAVLAPRAKPAEPAAEELTALARRFPDAPETYGTRPPDGTLPALVREKTPTFSWLGRVDPQGARFVASRRGRLYYPIDHPLARLIRAEDFVGYQTDQEARADGKHPFSP